ncbi:hypothetical protein [Shimia thalassica]|uniref:hypothetical protein n=1 Tax=Shimia thalassica TaxID=1715693 RepID=UPI0024942E67|nr:hypothetical protein [Shimia thalassica]
MSEISDLESRISAAMDRIGRSLEELPGGAADAGEMETLQQQLEEERLATAQMQERNRALVLRQESLEETVKSLESEIEVSRSYVDAGQAELEAAQTVAESAQAEAAQAVSDLEKARQEIEDAKAALSEAEAAAQEAANQVLEAAPEEPAAPTLDLDENRDVINHLSKRIRRLRITSRQLREANNLLREATEKQLPDHTLVNKALQAELSNLKAEREVELAEMDVIMGALRPMLNDDAQEKEAQDG